MTRRTSVRHRVSSFVITRVIVACVAMIVSPLAFADYVEVTRSAHIYTSPNSQSDRIQSVDPAKVDHPVYFAVVDQDRTDGYFHIRVSPGTRGWIYKTRVTHHTGPLPGTSATTSDAVYGGLPVDRGVGDDITRLENTGYAVGYSETKSNPLWVSFRLPATSGASGCKRLARFRTDDRTESKVTHNDYNNAGYDRGHMANSSAIGVTYGCEAQDETYFMSNITPQLPRLNQKAWAGFENVISDDYAERFGTVWVITGPIFEREFAQELCSGVEIAPAFYKIVVREVDGKPMVLAVIMKQTTPPGTPIRDLVTTVDAIEKDTDIDFFPDLSASAQATLESMRATEAEWKLDTKLDTSFAGAPRTLCVTDRHMRSDIPVDE